LTLCYKEIRVPPKIRAGLLRTLSQTLDLENFATARRSSQRIVAYRSVLATIDQRAWSVYYTERPFASMGVNATVTLGVAGPAPKTRESRRRRRRGGGPHPLPRQFMNFSSQNGVIWCILGVLYSEVPLKGKNKTLVKILGGSSTQDDPCRSNIGGSRPLQPMRR